MTMRSRDRASFLTWVMRVPPGGGAGSAVWKRNYNRATVTKSIRSLLCLALLVSAAGCAHHGADLSRPATQDNFGVQMAQMSLWREAMFRFQRAVQIAPGDAQAHNNLAVAYEANGDFEKARKEYLEALKLDRSNQYIQKNYSRFVEFLSRNRKRQPKEMTAASAKPTVPATATGPKTIDTGTPDHPVAIEPVKPQAPPAAPPSDLPPPNPPPQPQPNPPGGAL